VKKFSRELAVAGTLIALLLFMAVAAPSFFHPRPLLSLLTREAPVLVLACGVALVILTRQIDISIGSQFAVCSVCAGLMMAAKIPLALVVPATALLGICLGTINGLLVAGLGLPSIVVTLATMVTWREGLRWLRQGQFVTLPENTQWFGLGQESGQVLLVVASLLILAGLAWGCRNLHAGRRLYAVGSDAEAARLAGIEPRTVTFFCFAFMGMLCGMAAIMNVVQSPQVDPKSGTGLELRAIAAVVVGGVSISGGRGTLWGVLAGVLLLACISPALTHLHVAAYWDKAIQGAVILLAVMADGLQNRRRPAGGKEH